MPKKVSFVPYRSPNAHINTFFPPKTSQEELVPGRNIGCIIGLENDTSMLMCIMHIRPLLTGMHGGTWEWNHVGWMEMIPRI